MAVLGFMPIFFEYTSNDSLLQLACFVKFVDGSTFNQ